MSFTIARTLDRVTPEWLVILLGVGTTLGALDEALEAQASWGITSILSVSFIAITTAGVIATKSKRQSVRRASVEAHGLVMLLPVAILLYGAGVCLMLSFNRSAEAGSSLESVSLVLLAAVATIAAAKACKALLNLLWGYLAKREKAAP